jgi:hypothetical protein
MRKLVLTVIYYALFVPIAGLVRLFHDPLQRDWDAERASYWIFEGDAGAAPAPSELREEDTAANPERRPATAGPLRS